MPRLAKRWRNYWIWHPTFSTVCLRNNAIVPGYKHYSALKVGRPKGGHMSEEKYIRSGEAGGNVSSEPLRAWEVVLAVVSMTTFFVGGIAAFVIY